MMHAFTRLTLGVMGLAAMALVSPALAQGSRDFCGRYAANMAGVGQGAIARNPACLDYNRGVHGNYQMHFDWCMRSSPDTVQGAEGNIRRIVTQCTGNAQPPRPQQAAPRPQSSPGTVRFSGTWRWSNGNLLPATFELYPARRGEAGYCYGTGGGRRCFDVRYTLQGNSYTFTNNGTDWFVMTSPEPGVMNGRYWGRRSDTSRPPDATISMR